MPAYKFALPGIFALAACSTLPPNVTQPTNHASLIDAQGQAIGMVEWWNEADGTHLHLRARGLSDGLHGMHLHQFGRCDTPDFKSAQGHWNPTDRHHGHRNPTGWHLGDLGNLTVSEGREATANVLLPPGSPSLIDDDGTALVIHAKPDDEMTDPSGNSGDRVACAVIAPAK